MPPDAVAFTNMFWPWSIVAVVGFTVGLFRDAVTSTVACDDVSRSVGVAYDDVPASVTVTVMSWVPTDNVPALNVQSSVVLVVDVNVHAGIAVEPS